MQTPYKRYPYDEGKTSKSQRSEDISTAVLFALPAHASLKILESVTDQEQRYSINLGFREIESCEIVVNELADWDDPTTRFGAIDIVFDPAYLTTAGLILKDFTDNTLYITSSEMIDIGPLEEDEFTRLLKETGMECEKDPMLKKVSEISTHDFYIPQPDFHSGLQEILRSLIESCLARGLKFSSSVQADQTFSILYAHEKVLELLNNPLLELPGKKDQDEKLSRANLYSSKLIQNIPEKTRNLLQEIFYKK